MNHKSTVLLVDDNDELRASSGALLAGEGYQVLEAGNAAQAMQLLNATGSRVDAVVTDVNMPGGDGIALVAGIRRVAPCLPVVFISSHVDERLGRRISEGDVAFLAKPFGPSSLTEALATARRVAHRADGAAPQATITRPQPPARQRHSAARPISARPAIRLGLAAAAAILAIGIGFQRSRSQAPDLPSQVATGARRSIRVEPLFPSGTLAMRPATLSWKPVAGADAYRAEIRRIGYDLVWQDTVSRSSAALPKAVLARLDAGVTYTWRVEALSGGTRIAISEVLRFRIGAAPAASRGPRSPNAMGGEPHREGGDP